MSLTAILAWAALRPHRELVDREHLDWSPRLLDAQSRRHVEELFEYEGADVPLGTPPERLAPYRRVTTRTTSA